MTKKEFLKSISNGHEDVIQLFIDALASAGVDYCVIGGLAVNAYVEPVVSLDLDIVVATDDIEATCNGVKSHFKIERFAHRVNLGSGESDLRIQIQTDPRYQNFIPRAETRSVLGYKMKVACIEDVLEGKVWAYSDVQRRKSKRQKDLADIIRLTEEYPYLSDQLPVSIRNLLD